MLMVFNTNTNLFLICIHLSIAHPYLDVFSCFNFTTCMCAQSLQLYPTLCDPMDYGPQPPLCMEFPRQEFWSGLPFPPPRDLPNPRIEPASPEAHALQVDFSTEPPGKPNTLFSLCYKLIQVSLDLLIQVSFHHLVSTWKQFLIPLFCQLFNIEI